MVPDVLSDTILELDDSALQADHDGVSAVLRAEFGEDVSDLTFDRGLADGEALGNFLVCPAFGDEGQDPDFTGRQRIIRGVLGKLE
jgi:hypothetical protein